MDKRVTLPRNMNLSEDIEKTEWFIATAGSIHSYRFDYEQTFYINSNTPVTIICEKHGRFIQLPCDHLGGHGCPQCGNDKGKATNSYSQHDFENLARATHGDKYNYSKSKYVRNDIRIIICCPDHGDFEQNPRDHLSGRGCPRCGGSYKITQAEFEQRCRDIHGGRYCYKKTVYNGMHFKVIIQCKSHGLFLQRAYSHLAGSGCGKCARAFMTSASEDLWLSMVGVPDDAAHRQVQVCLADGTTTKIDGYLPELNRCFEFHGSFYHGDPALYQPQVTNKLVGMTHGELYARTIMREEKIVAAGFQLTSMWESELWRQLSELSLEDALLKAPTTDIKWAELIKSVKRQYRFNFKKS